MVFTTIIEKRDASDMRPAFLGIMWEQIIALIMARGREAAVVR